MWTVTTTPMTGASRHQDLLDIGQDVTAGFGRGKLARWSSAMRGNSAMRTRFHRHRHDVAAILGFNEVAHAGRQFDADLQGNARQDAALLCAGRSFRHLRPAETAT